MSLYLAAVPAPVPPAAPAAAPAAEGLIDRAGKIIAEHGEGPDGWCGGCLREGHWTFYPCYMAAWAQQVCDRPAAGSPEREVATA